MASEVLLPKQGNSVESCIIVQWKVAEGDEVKTGDAIVEVETDKATMDVESSADGVLLKQLVGEGDDVPVLSPIAIVGEAGEKVEGAATADAAAKRSTPRRNPSRRAARRKRTEPGRTPRRRPRRAPGPPGPRRRRSPRRRRRAPPLVATGGA